MGAAESSSTDRFKEQVVQEWTDPNTVAAWRKWHSKYVVQSAEVNEAIVQAAQVEPGMEVFLGSSSWHQVCAEVVNT